MTIAAAHRVTIPRRATTADACSRERVRPEMPSVRIKLQENASLRVRTRTTTTSFVGLRG